MLKAGHHAARGYRQLANNVRKRAGDEESALMRAQWEILAGTYVRLADQSVQGRRPKKIDDTGTYDQIELIGRS